MAWYRKEQFTPFDHDPIDGLFFLNGDALAVYLLKRAEAKGIYPAGKQFGTEGQKMPMIGFPSGATFELWEGANNFIVHLFGEMDLPLHCTRAQGLQQASQIAEMVGYAVQAIGENQLEVIGHDAGEHYRITYDDAQNRIVNVEWIKPKRGEKFEPPRLELLTDEIRAKLPPLRANEKLGLNAVAQVKFFTPDAGWTWYASEYDGTDTFFGLVAGYEVELGSFSLAELKEVRGSLGLPVERDKFFEPKTLQELIQLHEQGLTG